jgi:ribosome biogenesis GTPase / thiamine phosphate phosphatase
MSGAGGRQAAEQHAGVVVATAGRQVIVRDPGVGGGERSCVLAGQRAVVGDRVWWVDAPGSGGKLVAVEDRDNALVRADDRGREQVLAANLGGVLVVSAPQDPPFRAGLLDRYLVAASVAGVDAAVALNKVDLGVPDEVADELAVREAAGVPVLRASAATGEGLPELAALIAATERPWALVGHSGVGKTSLVAALLPGEDVGEIGALSEYWGQGRHTTTHSRVFELPGGGAIVDSPGIRTFAPGRIDARSVRDHFPGVGPLPCRYRDCLHREDESGCVASEAVHPRVLASYRRLLAEILRLDQARKPGARR